MLWCFLIPCGRINKDLEEKLLTKKKGDFQNYDSGQIIALSQVTERKKFFFLSMHTFHNTVHMDTKVEL